MKRAWLGAGVLGALVLGALATWLRPNTGTVAPARYLPPVRTVTPLASVPTPTPQPTTAPPITDPTPSEAVPLAFQHASERVASQCDLHLLPACRGDRCAVLSEAPNLDHPTAWAQMLFASPRFVASTALRDLGFRPRALPCGDALDALVDGAPTYQLARPDGTMVWCSGDPAVCDGAADVWGLGVSGFADGRQLFFERPRAD